MKRCPQCEAEYDDYVQYCFVDGAEIADAPANTAPPKRDAPPPGPSRSSRNASRNIHLLPPPEGVTPLPAPPVAPPPLKAPTAPPPPVRRPVQEGSSGPPIWALVFLFVTVIALFGLGGVVGALFLIGGSGPTAQPVEAPRPAPLPPPPTPNPEATLTSIHFESDPSGATIWEADIVVCPHTPCDVAHPDYAPIERKFVLKADGYQDTVYLMTDPTQVQHVQLTRPGPRPPRPPKPPKTPRPPGTSDLIIQR